MPRRTVTRCTRRTVAADQLDALVEWNLTAGECFGAFDLESRGEFARPWAVWADEITRRWSEAFPGSRPMAVYILGELPAPSWCHRLPGLRRPLRPIRGVDIEMLDVGWHRLLPEAEHLADIGAIDGDEYDRALARLAADDAIDHRRYRPVASP